MQASRPVRRTSLNVLLAAMGLGTLLVLMVVFVLFSYFIERSTTTKSLEALSETVATRLSESLKKPLWNYDTQTIGLSIDVEGRNPDIRYILVRNEREDVLAYVATDDDDQVFHGSAEPIPPLSSYTVFNSIRHEIFYETNHIGSVEVAVTDRQRQAAFAQQMLTTSFVQMGISILTILTILLGIHMLIIRRVVALRQTVNDYSEQRFDLRSHISREDEVGELARNFNRMADTIETYRMEMESRVKERTAQLVESEKLAFLGSLVAGIAHEINTPLGVSLTAVTYLENRSAELARMYSSGGLTKATFDSFLEEVRHSTSIVVSNLNRTSDLVRTFKGIGADQLQDDHRIFNVNDYLREVLFSLTPRLKKSNPMIEIDCDPHLQIKSYPSAFYQIFTNLIINTLIHGFRDGTGAIAMSVKVEDNKLIIVYRDNGVGIPEESLSQVFTPFFTTRRGQGGTGLGLYIVYTLISKLEGTIVCQSAQGKGTSFTIRLPASIVIATGSKR